LGIDLTTFSIFAGAIGVGIAFSLQNILSNFFSGFIILIDRSIKPGDVISLNDGKIYGIVNKLHARYVSVRTREGKEHLIPNQEIISHKLENWSFTDSKIRFEMLLKVDFDSDLDLVQKLLVEIAQKTPRVLESPTPYLRFSSMIDNAVEIKLRMWIKDPENGTSGIQSDIIFAAWKAFKEHGIRVPYPPREIISRKDPLYETV
jgi:small-conductance mechanosensitive channel